MTSTVLIASELMSGRPRAREFAADLAEDLRSVEVVIDWHRVRAAAPSFVDELVKEILVERNADSLILRGVPERTAIYARRSADRRAVADRMQVEPRGEPVRH